MKRKQKNEWTQNMVKKMYAHDWKPRRLEQQAFENRDALEQQALEGNQTSSGTK